MVDVLSFRRPFDGAEPDINLAEQKAAGAQLDNLVSGLVPPQYGRLPWIALRKLQADILLGFLPTNEPEDGTVAINVATFTCDKLVTVTPVCAYYLEDKDNTAQRIDYSEIYTMECTGNQVHMKYPNLWTSDGDQVSPAQLPDLDGQSDNDRVFDKAVPLDAGPVDRAEIAGLEILVKADDTKLTLVQNLKTIIALRHRLY